MPLSDHIKKDSPTNNFATLNPLASFASSHSQLTISNGNLKGDVSTTADNFGLGFSTLQLPKSGKFYAEVLVTYDGDGNSLSFGCVSPTSYVPTSNSFSIYSNSTFSGILLHQYNQNVRSVVNGSLGTLVSFSRTTTILGLLFDIDNSSMTGWYNNNQLAIASSGIAYDNYILAIESPSHASNRSDFICNFGQDPTFGGTQTSANGAGGYTTDGTDETGGAFFYQPPAGAKALCTANLEDITPNVDDDVPKDYMKSVIWTGNGTGTSRTINVGFDADFIWSKRRDPDASHPMVFDSLRSGYAALLTSLTSSEDPNHGNGYINNIGSNSFTFTDGSSVNFPRHNYNDNNIKYVAWCWKAGGEPSGDGVAMVDGSATTTTALKDAAGASITPTRMSVNTKAGFSIIKYTGNGSSSGATIPHGLNSAPDLVIVKCTTTAAISTNNWHVYHRSAGTGYLYLNLDWAYDSTATRWNSTNPNSQLIYLGGDSNYFNVENNINFICYAWHSVPGYSAFGSYESSSSADGPFVYTGFKPAWVMIKAIDDNGYNSYQSWTIIDNARSQYNPDTKALYANLTSQEGVEGNGSGTLNENVDILSNGFKIRTGAASINGISGITHIYAAFAEQPTKYATAR